MIWWLLATAWAAPPADFRQDDIDLWDERARVAVLGPSDRCYVFVGDVIVELQLHQPPSIFQRADISSLRQVGSFRGVLDRGTWTSFLVDTHSTEEGSGSDILIGPLFATLGKGALRTVVEQQQADVAAAKLADEAAAGGAPSEQAGADTDDGDGSVAISVGDGVSIQTSGRAASSILSKLVAGTWSRMPTTSYVQWDDDKGEAQLVIDSPLSEDHPNDEVRTEVRFPGGRAVPNAVDTTLPRRVQVGDGPIKVRVMAAQLHLRGMEVDGVLLPTVESVSGAVGFLGFTAGYEQRVIYRSAEPCVPGSGDAPDPAAGAGGG